MSSENETEMLPLWGESDPNRREYGVGATEQAVTEAIEAIHKDNPLDPSQRARAQICRSLAKNIDAGNTKGRAVANEAQQLDSMLEALRGVVEEENQQGSIPEDVRQLFELGSVPGSHDTTPSRNPEVS